jgi:tetratricopeptide (TPR) repeat protein
VPSGKAVRAISLGHRTLLSDLYWLAMVQYIGEPKADQRGWEKLFPLVDLVTDLDPRHGYAYQTAGIVLSAAGRLDESNRILQKGIDRGPPRWTYAYYLSFNHWFYRGDYAKGAEYAWIAAQQPGASPNIARLAVSLASKSGSPEHAIAMLEELRRDVQDEVSAAALDEQIKVAVVERDAQTLERAATRYEAELGRPLAHLRELVSAGYVRSIPPDPHGGEYAWHADERRIRSTADPFRFTLREGAHAPGFQYHPSERFMERMPR